MDLEMKIAIYKIVFFNFDIRDIIFIFSKCTYQQAVCVSNTYLPDQIMLTIFIHIQNGTVKKAYI